MRRALFGDGAPREAPERRGAEHVPGSAWRRNVRLPACVPPATHVERKAGEWTRIVASTIASKASIRPRYLFESESAVLQGRPPKSDPDNMLDSTFKRGSDGKHASSHETRAPRADESRCRAEALGRNKGGQGGSQGRRAASPRRRRHQASRQAFGGSVRRARPSQQIRSAPIRLEAESDGCEQGAQSLHQDRTADGSPQARPLRQQG